MMLGLCPILCVHVGLRTLSAGYVELPIWSCCRPSVWPISCATTNSSSRPMSESGKGIVRARGVDLRRLREVPVTASAR